MSRSSRTSPVRRDDHRLGDQRQRRHRTRRWGAAAGDRRQVGSVNISGTTITGNRTGLFGDGAGIHATSTNLTLTNSHVDGNIARPNDILVGGSGGGIAMTDGGSLIVTGTTIDDNVADAGGGGVTLLDVPTASFTASSISDNTAEGFGGGGFEAVGTGSSYSFVETTVDGNTSQLAGGGIDVATSGSGVQVLLDRSTVSDNTTVGSNGGGLFTNTPLSALTIRNSTVTGNIASSIVAASPPSSRERSPSSTPRSSTTRRRPRPTCGPRSAPSLRSAR